MSCWASAIAKAERTWIKVLVIMSSLPGLRAALVSVGVSCTGLGDFLSEFRLLLDLRPLVCFTYDALYSDRCESSGWLPSREVE